MSLIVDYVLRNSARRAWIKSLVDRSPKLAVAARHLGGASFPKSAYPAHGASVGRLAARILATGLFDSAYYASAVGIEFSSDEDAAAHYVTVGEANGHAPGKAFDPLLYWTYYTDLRGLTEPLLLHYAEHGKREGRVGVLDLAAVSVEGEQTHRSDLPTVLLSVHEASVTGAPILGYNIARHLSGSHNVVVSLFKNGSLFPEFRKYATRVIAPDRVTAGILPSEIMQRRVLEALLARHPIDIVMANSLETEPVVGAAQALGIPVMTLVHEFAEYVAPERLRKVLEGSQIVVFSSKLTEDSARQARVVADFRSNRILPQGKCFVPEERDAPDAELAAILAERRDGARLLVVGCGYVQIRKGVDLFVAVAAKVAAKLGADRVRFVWVGSGFDPVRDVGYSLWLNDQINRSGLADVVKMVPAVGAAALERLYADADVMLLSSRLDPFPNVAIDAMHAGLPIVAFDKATGVSEYLRRVEGGEHLVAPYLDIDAAAAAILRLVDDKGFKARMQTGLQSLAQETLDMQGYVGRLKNFFVDARKLSDQERIDFETLRGQDLVSRMTVGQTLGSIISDDHLLRRYIRFSAVGVQGINAGFRRPFPGFSPHIYADHHPEVAELPFPNPLAHWVRADRPAGPWLREVIDLRDGGTAAHSSTLKVGLHLHLHYPDLLDDILRRLDLNRTRRDLLISCGSAETERLLKRRLGGYQRGGVTIRIVPNRGRDIGPMVTEFADLLAGYDVVGHIHGKKSRDNNNARVADSWREFLFENLIGDKVAALDRILAAFEADSRLGLVFPEDPNVVGWTDNRQVAEAAAARLGLNRPLPNGIEFPVGNMFFARPAALAPLLKSGLTWDDYPAEPLPYDGTLLHAIERLVPTICESQGYTWRTTMVRGVTR